MEPEVPDPSLTLPTRTWRVAPAGRMLTTLFDGQTVVYHPGTGHTHWISAVAAEILERLGGAPMNEAELRSALVPMIRPDDLHMLDESLRESLDYLEQLTLIETP